MSEGNIAFHWKGGGNWNKIMPNIPTNGKQNSLQPISKTSVAPLFIGSPNQLLMRQGCASSHTFNKSLMHQEPQDHTNVSNYQFFFLTQHTTWKTHWCSRLQKSLRRSSLFLFGKADTFSWDALANSLIKLRAQFVTSTSLQQRLPNANDCTPSYCGSVQQHAHTKNPKTKQQRLLIFHFPTFAMVGYFLHSLCRP